MLGAGALMLPTLVRVSPITTTPPLVDGPLLNAEKTCPRSFGAIRIPFRSKRLSSRKRVNSAGSSDSYI